MKAKILWLSLGFLVGWGGVIYADNSNELIQPSVQGIEIKASEQEDIKIKTGDVSAESTLLKSKQQENSSLKFDGSIKSDSNDNLVAGVDLKFPIIQKPKDKGGKSIFVNQGAIFDFKKKSVQLKKFLLEFCIDKKDFSYAIGLGSGPSMFGNCLKVSQLSGSVWCKDSKCFSHKHTFFLERPIELKAWKNKESEFEDVKFKEPRGNLAAGYAFELNLNKLDIYAKVFNFGKYNFSAESGNLMGACSSSGSESGQDLLLFGLNLGLKYKILKDRLNVMLEGFYTSGTGHYIGEIASIKHSNGQGVVDVITTNNNGITADSCDALIGRGLMECWLTPKWGLTLGGSYVSILDEITPGAKSVLNMLWTINTKISYKLVSYLTLSSGYRFQSEHWRGNIGDVNNNGYSLDLKFSL